MICRRLELSRRGFGLISRGFGLIIRELGLISKGPRLISGGFGLISRGFGTSPRFETVVGEIPFGESVTIERTLLVHAVIEIASFKIIYIGEVPFEEIIAIIILS